MDKIIMKNLAFYGYHGVLNEETRLGQKFFIDIELFLNLKEAGTNDDLKQTVNYGEAYRLVKDITENSRFKLIEALAEKISDTLFKTYSKVEELAITVRKPEAPVNGIFDYFGVEIRRKRND